MFEAAWGAMANGINFIYQPGIHKEPGTPEWYATASRQDIVLNTRTVAAQPEQHDYPYIYMAQSSATYVTGSHSLKTGFQWRYGPYWRDYSANADLVQRYSSGVPDSVTVYNTPTHPRYHLNADVGVYVQDSWKIQRLTAQPGHPIRVLQFADRRPFNRAGPVHRLTPVRGGSGSAELVQRRAAVRGCVRFDGRLAHGVEVQPEQIQSQRYDGLRRRATTPPAFKAIRRNWRDCDYLPGTSTCSGRVLATNGDNIAQDNEIGPSNNSRFGAAPARRADADIRRVYNLEYSVGVDHQVLPMLAVGASWYRRSWYNLEWQDNLLVAPSDYAPFDVVSPLDGEIITVYNLDRSKQGLVDALDTNGMDRSKTRRTYDGLEVNFSARLPKGGSVFGGWSADKNVSVACELDNPNFASDPATATPWSYRYCDQSAQSMPFRNDFKVTGAYPLPLDMQVGATWASYAGDQLRVNWSVPANLFPGGRTQSVTIDLIPPGSKFLERWNQVDLSLRKLFNMQRTQFNISLDMFNVLNSNVVLSETQAYGPALGNPTSILQPRLLRISGGVKF